ncbi:secreted protein of Ly-6 domain 1-like [Cavia porcellus]|uniref:secreted protein of Ly-6 domain 1-like n=1 Tax=Cavia porcellus TaxID=10141 RepID=UPI00035087C2
MGKHLLLLLGLALLSGFVHALTCVQCDRTNADGVCQSRESTCQTSVFQQCFLRKIYKDGKFQYARQGCSSLCFPSMLFNQISRVQFMCCNKESFCNRL